MIILWLGLLACEDIKSEKVLEQEKFEGPSIEMDSVTLFFTDSTKVKIKLQALKELVMENNDKEFPEGVYIEFFDEKEAVSSVLVADRGYYVKRKDHYRAEGNVVLYNVASKDELSTEELIWTPKDEQVHTDKFVTIKSEDEIHTGEGLTADQDFGSYTILNPSGTLSLEETF
ncbi:MAG: LPS export ABC transporter periplasmic protein LptC [Cyclobacteriaceae bacterium]